VLAGNGRGPGAFGAQLRRLRERAGLSQAALAEHAGLGVNTLAALELERRRPHPRTLAALVSALGLTPAERDRLHELAEHLGGRRPPSATAATALRDGSRPRVSLPSPLTPLIGRESEVNQASALLDPARGACRLLTLLGPGGVGKTRLAIAVASALVGRFAAGVVFVDLAPLHDARLVAATIARALGLREAAGRSARELLLDDLHDRQVLLVLDNLEHLLGAAPLLAELLRACPRLVLLVTSRTAVRLRGERRFVVAPLAAANPAQSLDAIATAPAVQLFVERAQAVVPAFALSEANAGDLARICGDVDGLPLAIELAAARVGLLPPAALLRRLEHRLPLLTGGTVDLPPRQQTLRQTLAWSYELLGDPDRALFRRLAVFAGGWTLDAAEAVCTDAQVPATAVLDRLQVLVDSSLVQVRRLDDVAAEPRFGMLETIREFAQEALHASGEAAAIGMAHAGWMVALAEAVEPQLSGPDQAHGLARLAVEQDNCRAALRWVLEAGDLEAAGRLVWHLYRAWWVRGQLVEARQWADEILVREAPPLARARATLVASLAPVLQGDAATAAALLEAARVLAQAVGDRAVEGTSLYLLGCLAPAGGDIAAGIALVRQGQALLQASGAEWAVGFCLDGLTSLYLLQGGLDEAERCAEQYVALAQRLGNRLSQARAFESRATVALLRQDVDQAASLLRAALAIALEVGPLEVLAYGLLGLAVVAAREDPVRAARQFGAADVLRAAASGAMWPARRRLYEPVLAHVRATLGAAAFDAAWAEGRAMTREQAVADALEAAPSGTSTSGQDGPHRRTGRDAGTHPLARRS